MAHETAGKPAPVVYKQPPGVSTEAGGIELAEFSSHPAVRDWTCSTEQLVPSPKNTPSLEHNHPEPPKTITPNRKASKPRSQDLAISNYKPIPLRTPFLVFLFAFISGIFAFLEYQVHDLPPTRYSVINLDAAGRAKQYNQSEIIVSTATLKASVPAANSQYLFPQNPGSFITITRTAHVGRAVMAPEPEPDPRPPDTAYPGPAAPVIYCGWYPPRWYVWDIRGKPEPCDQLPPDKPGYDLCSGNNTGEIAASHNRLWRLEEYIRTFVTNDSSWCPCRASERLGYWGS